MRFLFLFFLLIGIKAFGYMNVSAEEFARLVKDKNAIIIDVRTPQEYNKDGHIKNSNLIPVQVLKYTYLPMLKGKKVLVYCRSGNRSVIASRILEQMGIKEVYNLKGGILEWKSKKLPVVYGWK